MSSNDHHHNEDTTLQSPTTTTNELHTPMTTPPTTSNNSTTPESRLAAAIGQAISTIPSTSFEEAIAIATKPLIRTISDANSSVVLNQDSSTTTTVVTNSHCPIQRDMITTAKMGRPNKPGRRALSDTAEYQQSKKMTPPPRKTSSSPTAALLSCKTPYSEVVKKIEEMVRESMVMLGEQRDVQNLDTKSNPSPNQSQAMEEQEEHEKEECVGVERAKNGDINFELSCSCGKHFEMLIKHNGYCFYKLT